MNELYIGSVDLSPYWGEIQHRLIRCQQMPAELLINLDCIIRAPERTGFYLFRKGDREAWVGQIRGWEREDDGARLTFFVNLQLHSVYFAIEIPYGEDYERAIDRGY